VARRFGEQKAQKIEELIQTFPITFLKPRENFPVNPRTKATKRMAYADCFAVALARLEKAELYTGGSELKAVEKDIKVVWL